MMRRHRVLAKRIGLAIILACLALLLGRTQVMAQNFTTPLWEASYWNNRNLSGSPVLVRPESSINYSWGGGSPAGEIEDDDFSARWTGYMHFNPGTYRFAATSDDGIRVWVDGDLIIDHWSDHQIETYTGDKNLSAGPHYIVVEYYEHQGGATVQFWWAPAPPPDGNNWRGAYYNNTSLSGDPVLVREDPVIGFNWTTVSPGPGVNADNFSVRWTNTIDLPAGNYNFFMTVDDGGRLWVNGRQLIDAWQVQSPHTYQASMYLPGGPTPIRMEYFDNNLGAVAQLSWTRQEPQLTEQWREEYYNGIDLRGAPTLVRYTPQVNFNWGAGSPAPGQLGVDYFSARWTRTINPPAGTYRFYVTVDDGARLWVDDRLVIDAWRVQTPQTYTGDVYLSGQPTAVRLDYFEATGGAMVQLSWNQLSQPPQTSTDWRQVIPPQYHAQFQGCLDYLSRVGLQLGPSPNWNAIFDECQTLANQPQP